MVGYIEIGNQKKARYSKILDSTLYFQLSTGEVVVIRVAEEELAYTSKEAVETANGMVQTLSFE